MTPWTRAYLKEFIEWHESVIAQYPEEIQKELRGYRIKFLGRIMKRLID